MTARAIMGALVVASAFAGFMGTGVGGHSMASTVYGSAVGAHAGHLGHGEVIHHGGTPGRAVHGVGRYAHVAHQPGTVHGPPTAHVKTVAGPPVVAGYTGHGHPAHKYAFRDYHWTRPTYSLWVRPLVRRTSTYRTTVVKKTTILPPTYTKKVRHWVSAPGSVGHPHHPSHPMVKKSLWNSYAPRYAGVGWGGHTVWGGRHGFGNALGGARSGHTSHTNHGAHTQRVVTNNRRAPVIRGPQLGHDDRTRRGGRGFSYRSLRRWHNENVATEDNKEAGAEEGDGAAEGASPASTLTVAAVFAAMVGAI